jgi:putative restriction endonuclease
MFDKGTFSITDDLKLVGAATGELTVHETHILNKLNLQYHRKSHGYD